VPAVGGIRLALDQPRGVWVAILGASCLLVLCLASSIPFRRVEALSDAASRSEPQRATDAPAPPVADGAAR